MTGASRYGRRMSESEPETGAIRDEDLPEDLQPGEDNPLAEPPDEDVDRDDLGVVAETVRDLAGRGVPVDEALAAGEWPWEPSVVERGVRRAYEQLPRSQKRLPLI